MQTNLMLAFKESQLNKENKNLNPLNPQIALLRLLTCEIFFQLFAPFTKILKASKFLVQRKKKLC